MFNRATEYWLTQMRTVYLIALFTFSMTPWLNAGEVYRHVDESGNVTFSDQPQQGADKIEVEPANVHNFPKAPAIKPLPDNRETDFRYRALTILYPENDTTLRNTGDISVSAAVDPKLKKQHQVRFTDNGQAVAEPTKELSIQLKNLSRGSHQLQAQILDEKGKVLISSNPVTVHVHRTSILHKKPASPSPSP